MQLNKIGKCIATSALLSQLITYSGVSYAGEKQSNSKTGKETTAEQAAPSPQGLMGYYYQDQHFQQLALMGHRQTTDLKIPKSEVKDLLSKDQQQIQSARWIGYIKPSQTGEYLFSTSSDQHVIIQLDDNQIVNQSSMAEPIQLEKGKSYKIRIEYVPEQTENKDNLLDLQLNWSISGGKVEAIPEQVFFLPDLSRKKDKEKLIPKTSLFQERGAGEKVSRSKSFLAMDDSRDTDDDSIPDQWEIDGYTIQKKVAVKWNDSMKELGYKKYVSDPYNSHTVRDPYTDWEKAAGHMDAAIKQEARNPLVAAYPSVGVHMEKLIISNNQNVSSQEGKSVSSTTSSSSTSENMVGVDVSAGYSLLGGFNAQVTGRYSHTWSSSSSVEDSSSNNWSTDLGINTGQAAYLNANVRYYNTGTAPIYNVKPTTNFVLKGDSIVTVKAKENQIGNVLQAGSTYPDKQHAPIALNTLDDFGSQLISVNYNQMKQLESGEKLNLQTTQASGLYGVIKANGGLSVDPSQEWDPVKAQIESASASIILDTGEETFERRVAAKDYRDLEDLTPETTLGEAIAMAFDTTEKDGELYYKDMPLRESVTGIVFDENTAKEVKAQLDKMPDQNKKLYNVKIKRGMNIMIQKPVWFDHFDSYDHAKWSGDFTIAKEQGIRGDAGRFTKETFVNLNEYGGFKPNTAYLFSVYAKSSTPAKLQPFYFYGDSSSYQLPQYGRETNLNASQGYQRIQMKFTTDEKGKVSEYQRLGLRILEGTDILIDDALLLELRPAINQDVLDTMEFTMDNSGNIFIGGPTKFMENTTIELFMNGHRKGSVTYDKGSFAGGAWYPIRFGLSYLDTMNPNNTFEMKVNGKIIASFNGVNSNGEISNGTYQIVSALNNSSVVDMDPGTKNVHLWQNGNGNNQKWRLVYNPTKSAYQLKSVTDENFTLSWNFSGGYNNVFAKHSYSSTLDEHYWIIEDAGDGYFYLKNKKDPKKVLDVSGGSSANGTNMIIWDYQGSKNQKFKLQKLD
ncbi:binary toxin-like calcium binding domain-containing protein [Bacillus cereus]|uniref:binary toxin-like calcium binding domain-containing protein n=1 Tax=Bacillus cereus TaxID=1396 RepID=UPI000BEE7DE5|nr:binary toxin-like calcium binding domain-containing protein [Bacillus cereus]PEA01355.1 iota toxin protein Ib [Bacillus cereus]